MTYDSALTALSDPTRRAILERLAARPLAVAALAQGFPVSRPAISQHLRVLSDAGLVIAEAQGTRRVYRLDPGGVEPLRRYLDRLWTDALSAFAAEADRTAQEIPG